MSPFQSWGVVLLVLFAAAAPLAWAKEKWCFVTDDCNQKNKDSEWNKGICASGKLQSPIDLGDVSALAALPGGPAVEVTKDDFTLTSVKASNDGKYTELTTLKSKSGKKPILKFGDKGSFQLEELHLHWGPDDKDGSEHHIKGTPLSGEVHLVLYNTKFPDYAAAKKASDPNALGCLAILFQAGGDDLATKAFQPLVDNLAKVADKGMSATLEGTIDLHSIIKTQAKVAAYQGSFTVPPCTETVQWFVGITPVGISSETLNKLRTTIKGVDGKPMLWNRRFVKPTNGRVISLVDVKH